MASYRVLIKPPAAKELEALPLKERKRIVSKIQHLSKDPRPTGCEKLSGREKYRVRQEDYRVLYAIDDRETTIPIVKIGHRRDVYR